MVVHDANGAGNGLHSLPRSKCKSSRPTRRSARVIKCGELSTPAAATSERDVTREQLSFGQSDFYSVKGWLRPSRLIFGRLPDDQAINRRGTSHARPRLVTLYHASHSPLHDSKQPWCTTQQGFKEGERIKALSGICFREPGRTRRRRLSKEILQ